MWVNQPKTNKHIFIDDTAFDLIHFIEDCYRNTKDSKQLLFEFSGSWYIATMVDDNRLRFNNDFYYLINSSILNNIYCYVSKINGEWIAITGFSSDHMAWKAVLNQNGGFDDNTLVKGNYKIDTNTNKLNPFPIGNDSENLDNYIEDFKRHGLGVYKNNSMFGVYQWQGVGSEDDIIVGYRSYTHKALDAEGQPTDINVIVQESVGLTGEGASWIYLYNGVTYTYNLELPLSSFTMESGDGNLNMTYTGLIQLNKDVILFDGGAQIVD